MTAEPLPDPPAPLGVRRSDPRKRRTLNRDAIVDVALAIVDEEGLEGLSMRHVAERLQTGPASLYAHVANKDELMELVYDRVLAEVKVQRPDKRRWEEQLKDALRQLYDVLIAHRDIAFVSMARVPIGPNMLRVAEDTMAILRAGNVPDRVASLAMDYASLAVNSLAYEQSLYPKDATDEEIEAYYEQVANYFSALPADRFPTLASMAGALTEPGPDERNDFAFDVIVQGIAALARDAKRRK
ncbi:MAG TPA: TetR/AcrR family transcriptional regulator C-terminal domain-containing protein [Thermoleophilaceae bacterium]|jgi:AcrR family transcriptional regulator